MFQRGCQLGITGALLGVLGLLPFAFGGVPAWALLTAECLIWVAAGFWLLLILTEDEFILITTPVLAPILVIAAYVVVRYALTDVESLARSEMINALAVALMFMLVLQHLSPRRRLGTVAWVFIGTGCLVAGWGAYQWLFNQAEIWGQSQPVVYRGRASGPFVRPGHFGSYLSICFSVTAAFFFFSRWSLTTKISLSLAAVLMALGVLMSSSLAALAGLLAGIAVIGVALARHQAYRFRWLAVGSCLLLVILVGASLLILTRQLGDAEPPRVMLWKSGWNIARDQLLIGHGPGIFAWLHPTERALQGSVGAVGNEFLNLLADYGLVGVGLALWLVTAFIYSTGTILLARLRRYSIRTRSNRYAMVVAGLAAMTAAFVHSMVDFNLHAPANMFALVTLAGLAAACGLHPESGRRKSGRDAGRQHSTKVEGFMRVGFMISLALIMFLLGSRLQLSVPTTFYLVRGQRAWANLDWAMAAECYRAAWRHDPASYLVASTIADFYLARATWSVDARAEYQQEALRWFERAYIRNPYAGEMLIKMARVYDALGDQDQAYRRYRRALKFDPQNASYHAQLGLHHQRWNQTDQATASFIRAYELGGAGTLPAHQLRQLNLL